MPLSCRHLTPLGQRYGAVLLVSFARNEVSFEVEVVVDRGVDGGKLLKRLNALMRATDRAQTRRPGSIPPPGRSFFVDC